MSRSTTQTAKASGRRAARAVLARISLAPVASLPGGGGPGGVRAVLVQARLLVLGRKDHAAGLRLLERLPRSALGTTGHALRAWALHSLGRADEATEEARVVLDGGPGAEALALATVVVRSARDPELVARATALATTARPQSSQEAARLLRSFRTDEPEQAAAFIANARTWTVGVDRHALARIRSASEIRAAGEESAQRARALAVGRQSPEGFREATRTLGAGRAWDQLRELYADTDPRLTVLVPRTDALALAQRASRAGWLETAQLITDRLIRTGASEEARLLHDRVSDQIQIARTGWPVDQPRERAYEPDGSSVVSVLAQSLPHRSGGYATRSHGILTSLAELGWDVHATTRLGFPYDFWDRTDLREVADEDVVDTVTYRRLLEPGERDYRTTPMAGYIERFATRLVEVATEHRAGLIHASSFQNNGLAGLRAARRLGIPFVYEMRGLEDLMKISRDPGFGRTDAYRYMTGLELHIVQQADLTFVITEALRAEMIRRGGPADRILVLPNGVHTDQFEPREPDQALLDELGLRGRTIIGYAGGLVDYEGLDVLLHAAAQLKATRDDFGVVIVGDGPSEARLHRLARQLDVLDVVTFTGRVPHEEVVRYLSLFQVTPFPRLARPVCELISPIKPFEAMAMGTACIVSSVAALTEIVQPEVRGLIFRTGDAGDLARQITRYLEDPRLRRRLGARGQEWVLAERDWRDVTRIVDRAYHSLLG